MAEKNPYDGLFSLKEDDATALAAKHRVAPADQKARDTDAVGSLQSEWAKTIARLDVLRSTPIPTNAEKAEEHKAEIRRTEADLPSIQRELKSRGVEVTASQASANPASAPASAPAPAASGASANPFAGLFGDLKDEPPAPFEIDPFMVASGGLGALAGGMYAGRQMDRLALMRLEREYGLSPGTLTSASKKDLARLIAAPPRPVAPPAPAAVAPVTAPTSTGALPAAENSPTAQSTRILQGGEGDTLGTTGRARQTGYNTETAQQAAAKKEADAAAELVRRAGVTNRNAGQVLADQPGLTSSPAGVVYPRVEPRPTAGPRPYSPDVWTRPRAIGPAPFVARPAAPAPVVSPLPTTAVPVPPPPAAPPEAPNAPRRGSMSPLQNRAANVGVGAVAGLGGGLQAYNMASNAQQGKTPDWTEGLSLAGNLAPILSRARVTHPAALLMQFPYLYKHWREIAAGLNMGDIMPYGTSTLAEENQPVFPTPGR